MKKLVTVLLLTMSLIGTVHADRWRHGGGHYYYHPYYGWAIPAVVGGVIVYQATRPPSIYVQPNTVYIQQTIPPALPVYPAPAGYHWEALLDGNCNCYKTVLVPN
jgi:hypothetical protein